MDPSPPGTPTSRSRGNRFGMASDPQQQVGLPNSKCWAHDSIMCCCACIVLTRCTCAASWPSLVYESLTDSVLTGASC